MILAETYFDESETADGRIFCVAGYVFQKDRLAALEDVWSAILVEFGLSHFHMVDCAHGNGEFARLTIEQRVEVQTKLFDALKEHMDHGICITFDTAAAEQFQAATLHGVVGVDPYTLCAYSALHSAGIWARKQSEPIQVAYFFEAGSANQAQANRVMHKLFDDPPVADRFRYAGHSFIPKRNSAAIQCADILAWQGAKDRKSLAEGRPRRKDLMNLLEREHYFTHLDANNAGRMLRALKRHERQASEKRRSFYWWWARLLPGGVGLELLDQKFA